MECPKCGETNSNGAKFCKNCGTPLNTQVPPKKQEDNHKKIIIGLIIVIIAILAIGGLYGMGVFKGEVPLENKNFEGFTIDVPVGSKYVITDATTTDKKNIVISYENTGEHKLEAFGIIVSNNATNKIPSSLGELYKKENGTEIYRNDTIDIYNAYTEDGNAQVMVFGSDLNAVERMAKSFKEVDITKFASEGGQSTSTSSSTTSSTPSSSTPSSISILGGSFSTGSAEEDKTYARINVGTSHAGEDVIVQILYSRDGNSLNNGNMVPASVHSDGYLEIASADAYHYYPDHATIKIYDSNSKLLTTQSVSLNPTSGTQTF